MEIPVILVEEAHSVETQTDLAEETRSAAVFLALTWEIKWEALLEAVITTRLLGVLGRAVAV